MSVKSILDVIGSDAKKVFAFLGSPKSSAVVSAGEAAIEDVFPAATGVINLANSWFAEIFKAQALATSAAESTGSSTQKAAIALNAITPNAISFAESQGLPVPTGDKLAAANAGLVAFLNAFSVSNVTTSAASVQTAGVVGNGTVVNATTGAAVTMGK